MRAGSLHRRVTIEQVTETKNSTTGIITKAWTTFGKLWMSVEPTAGKEGFSSETRFGEVTHLFKSRYLADVTPKMRLNYDSRTFDIVSALDKNDRRRGLDILATERV